MSQKKAQIRLEFRTGVFERDNYTCRKCGATCSTKQAEKLLNAHHITDRNEIADGGYVILNGITLCLRCHEYAERFHESGGKEWIPGFHPDDLYALIGSSKKAALEVAEDNRLT